MGVPILGDIEGQLPSNIGELRGLNAASWALLRDVYKQWLKQERDPESLKKVFVFSVMTNLDRLNDSSYGDSWL